MSTGSLSLPVYFACGFHLLPLGNSLFCAKQLALDGSLFVGNKQHVQVILYSSRGHLGTTGKSQCAIWVSVRVTFTIIESNSLSVSHIANQGTIEANSSAFLSFILLFHVLNTPSCQLNFSILPSGFSQAISFANKASI